MSSLSPQRVIPAVCALLVAASLATADDRLVGPDRCGECHQLELHAWKASAHQTGYRTMHREPDAKAWTKALGGKRVKRDERCAGCHYTSRRVDELVRPTAGVSCESCHGAARDWLDGHSDYGGEGATVATETVAHREARLLQAREAGMFARFNLYPLADRCFDCHIVADPELVALGHPALSPDFELVAWTQGQVRHNFFFSPDKRNRPATAAERRRLYVLGRVLAVAHSVEALAAAPVEATPYREALATAVTEAIGGLQLVVDSVGLAALADAARRAEEATEPEAMAAAAEALRSVARSLAAGDHDARLDSVDDALPAESVYRGVAITAAPR